MISIVLIKEVENLGKPGETVRVKPGYGRNYLIPGNFAVIVGTPEARKILERVREQKEEKQKQIKIKEVKKIEQAKKQETIKEEKEKLLKKRKKVV